MPYAQINGFAAHYTEAGKGETVVLLHAGGTSSAHWRKIAPQLQGRFRVVAPDLIGFGETGSWSGERELTHDDQAALVRGVIELGSEEGPAGPVHVAGHSYGGAVAVRLALNCPELVKSLFLIEPVLTPLLRQAGEDKLFEMERSLANAFIADYEAGRSASAWRRFIDHHNGDGTWESLSGNARYRFLSMTRETADAYRSNLNNPTTLYDLRALTMPTLVACGARTTETYRLICRILRGRIPGCANLDVEGAAHMSPLSHPDQIADAIDAHAGAFERGEGRLEQRSAA
ncbi:MAG: alpha/beta fold hydrolase [Alphaproteobacteria bacterium]